MLLLFLFFAGDHPPGVWTEIQREYWERAQATPLDYQIPYKDKHETLKRLAEYAEELDLMVGGHSMFSMTFHRFADSEDYIELFMHEKDGKIRFLWKEDKGLFFRKGGLLVKMLAHFALNDEKFPESSFPMIERAESHWFKQKTGVYLVERPKIEECDCKELSLRPVRDKSYSKAIKRILKDASSYGGTHAYVTDFREGQMWISVRKCPSGCWPNDEEE